MICTKTSNVTTMKALCVMEKCKKLASTLDSFVEKTLSSPNNSHFRTADGLVSTKEADVADFLTFPSAPILLLDEMSTVDWNSFCQLVSTPYDTTKTNVCGIHPTVIEIFSALKTTSGLRYKVLPGQGLSDLADNQLKIPDISIVLYDCSCDGDVPIEDVVIPVVIRKFHDLRSAIHQALGYLASKLRNQLELVGTDRDMFGFCFGIDGLNLSCGFFSIEDYIPFVGTTGDDGVPFWSDDGYPPRETEGIRLLRTLLSLTPQQLGHPSTPLNGLTTYTPLYVLGRGAFCTALEAVDGEGNHMVIKRPSLNSQPDSDPLEMLVSEANTLRLFNDTHLPRLCTQNWIPTTSSPYLPLLPVGLSLAAVGKRLHKDERKIVVNQLVTEMRAGLSAAHILGMCHRDIRPDNVVYDPIQKVFVIIDWGLAAAIGTNMHPYNGSVWFWHEEIYFARWKIRHPQDIAYYERHDLESVKYVAFAFQEGYITKQVPWAHKKRMPEVRSRELGNFCV